MPTARSSVACGTPTASASCEYLKAQGLQPHHRLVDIGCGPFRAGRHFIDYLDPGNYYAVDANHSLIQAGYDVELSDEQRDRLPVTNLRANDRFDVDFGVPFCASPPGPAGLPRRGVAGGAGWPGTRTRRVAVRAPETIVGPCRRPPAPARPPAS